jgi:hypothetical protein
VFERLLDGRAYLYTQGEAIAPTPRSSRIHAWSSREITDALVSSDTGFARVACCEMAESTSKHHLDVDRRPRRLLSLLP